MCYYFINTIPRNIKNNIPYQYGGKNQYSRKKKKKKKKKNAAKL